VCGSPPDLREGTIEVRCAGPLFLRFATQLNEHTGLKDVMVFFSCRGLEILENAMGTEEELDIPLPKG
jgi:hypothetical protein